MKGQKVNILSCVAYLCDIHVCFHIYHCLFSMKSAYNMVVNLVILVNVNVFCKC